MNENYGLAPQTAQGVLGTLRTPTVGENLDDRINQLEKKLAALKELKQKLQTRASLLDINIGDLRDAMNY